MQNNPVDDNLLKQFPEHTLTIPNEDDSGSSWRESARQLGKDATDALKAWTDMRQKDANEHND